MHTKAHIFKLPIRPVSMQDALRVRYYIRAIAQSIVISAVEELGASLERVLFNCEPIMNPVQLDAEHLTVYRELSLIQAALHTPIRNFVIGAVTSIDATCVLNIAAAVYDYDQLILSYEVYYR